MDYGTFTTTQSVEIYAGGDYLEHCFEITIRCTALGTPAQLSGPPENCYPAEGPEFELETIAYIHEDRKREEISQQLCYAFLGQEQANELIENAADDAGETGDFG